jgi:mycothiol synthase
VKPPTGFAIRPATPDDALAVAELMVAFDRAHLEDPDLVAADDVVGWWSRCDPARDVLLAHEGGGALAAHGMVRTAPEWIELDAFVHPERKGLGLGAFMLDWAEREARARGRSLVRTSALTADAAARPLIEDRGFEPVRHFYRMLVDLDAPPPEPVWPEGFSASTFAPGEEEVLHGVTDQAFADHWGNVPRSLDEWQRTVFGRDWWDPTLVYLVRAGDEVVAAEINGFRFGVGWVDTLGVLEAWRGRGLGRALLLLAFREFYRRGQRRIGLAVDAGNETGATHLYESVGMRVAWQADVYEKRM